jgi:hypothetical protein
MLLTMMVVRALLLAARARIRRRKGEAQFRVVGQFDFNRNIGITPLAILTVYNESCTHRLL